MSHRWCLIANPRSAGGATAGRLDGIVATARATLGDVRLLVTERPGHATELARRAVDDGADRIVAIGGDGTASEVVGGLFDGRVPRNPSVAFGLIGAGTGGDLARTLKVPRDPALAFQAFARAVPRPIDAMHLSLRPHGPHPDARVERIAINVVGFGLNGVVVERANRSSKRFGGRATFLAATLGALRSYDPVPVRIEYREPSSEEHRSWSGRLSAAFVANAEYCGGGMWVGRGSAIDDGAADLTVIPKLPLSRMITGGPRLFTGTIDHVKEVSRVRIRHLVAFAETDTPVAIDADGEQPGFLPMEVTMLEKTLLSLA